MQVSGKNYQLLTDALVNGFTHDSLERMLEFGLAQRLDRLAGHNDDIDTAVFKVIGAYRRRDQVEKLVQAARRFNPTNGRLHQIAQALARATQVTAHLAGSVTPVAAGDLEKLVRRQIPQLNSREMRAQMMRVEGLVCLVERRLAGGPGEALGSGFLIGPDLVLTNYHVVEGYLGDGQTDHLQVRFDSLLRETDVREPEDGVVVAVDEISLASPYTQHDRTNVHSPPAAGELDFALLRLAEDAGNGQVGGAAGPGQEQATRGWLPLPDPAPDLQPGDPLIIYHYPGGHELQMAIDTEAVVGLVWDGKRLRYRNNTAPGSSGSPVLNFNWELVALHHGGPPGAAQEYNQGIPAARIRAHLVEQGLAALLAP